jgi:nucleotide-binding universal stress UspA family protein
VQMYKHILIPTDGSELSQKAINHGIGLAKALNALSMPKSPQSLCRSLSMFLRSSRVW